VRKILKFGGSSVADADCITQVSGIIQQELQNGDELYIVVSALRGVTDALMQLGESIKRGRYPVKKIKSIFTRHEQIGSQLGIGSHLKDQINLIAEEFDQTLADYAISGREYVQWRDELLSYGERLSSNILAACLKKNKIETECLDARKVVLTDTHFGDAYVHYQRSYDRIREYMVGRTKLQVITGFLGATDTGMTTTLGRSGSDYSASIFGAALNVDEIEIWTDVDGIMTANPDLVDQAVSIPALSYEEAMELAHAGAKVIFPPTMIPALYKQIPIVVKNTFNPAHMGTRISGDSLGPKRLTVGLSSVSHVSLLRLQGAGMVGVRGINARLFTCLAQKGISIMLVSQAFSEHSTCFAIKPDETKMAVDAIEHEFAHELRLKYIDKIRLESDLSLVAVVGEGMQNTPGFAGTVFGVLGKADINVEAIAQGSSKRNISFIVSDSDVRIAIRAVHKQLFEDALD